MIGLLQRVKSSSVTVSGEKIASIKQGLLVFVGIEAGDTDNNADRLAKRILGYRVFSDDLGRMNLSVKDIQGEVLLVPQFTLVADTASGMRPSFSRAAAPEQAKQLFDQLADLLGDGLLAFGGCLAKGQFGADMEVSLINDGPVTFCLNA